MKTDTFRLIKETGIISILRGVSEQQALFTVEALCKAGIKAIEVTFNTPGAAGIIAKIASGFAGQLVVGAGTITDTPSAVNAIGAGANFILAPNTDPNVISIVKKYGKLMIPGAFTPTEVLACYERGADIVKLFPASSVGPQFIKDIKGPFNHVELMPVGGINLNNTKDFIKAGSIAVGLGGSLIKKDLLEKEDYKGIEDLAKRFIEEVEKGRL